MKFAELMAGTSLQFFGESAADREATGVSCDTRTMRAGDIFFAVAPQFARTALEALSCRLAAASRSSVFIRWKTAGSRRGSGLWKAAAPVRPDFPSAPADSGRTTGF